MRPCAVPATVREKSMPHPIHGRRARSWLLASAIAVALPGAESLAGVEHWPAEGNSMRRRGGR